MTNAPESASCDDASVLSTSASDADLQAQLDMEKEITAMLTESGIESEAVLVGPNWLFKAPQAPELKEALGGVVVGSRS